MNRSKPRAAVVALVAALTMGLPVATTAPVSVASAKTHCPSKRTVAKALTKTHRKHLDRTYHPKGVYGVRCSGKWAAAAANYRYDGNLNAYPVLVRRKHGRWHEVLRDKPCRKHKVPAKIYDYACNSS